MKNKVLVEIIVPVLDERYSLFLPINKRIGKIITLINKAITELSGNSYVLNNSASLYNRITGVRYQANMLISETDIRNGAVLVLD